MARRPQEFKFCQKKGGPGRSRREVCAAWKKTAIFFHHEKAQTFKTLKRPGKKTGEIPDGENFSFSKGKTQKAWHRALDVRGEWGGGENRGPGKPAIWARSRRVGSFYRALDPAPILKAVCFSGPQKRGKKQTAGHTPLFFFGGCGSMYEDQKKKKDPGREGNSGELLAKKRRGILISDSYCGRGRVDLNDFGGGTCNASLRNNLGRGVFSDSSEGLSKRDLAEFAQKGRSNIRGRKKALVIRFFTGGICPKLFPGASGRSLCGYEKKRPV